MMGLFSFLLFKRSQNIKKNLKKIYIFFLFEIFQSLTAVILLYMRAYEPFSQFPGDSRLQQTNRWIIAPAGRLKLQYVSYANR